MATSSEFTYNSGTGITGTTQVGNIAVGNSSTPFSPSGFVFRRGPDEDLGYIIAHTTTDRTAGHQSTVVSGNTIGYWRSVDKTDAGFLQLCNSVFNQGFVSTSTAKTWLNTNGYWTSYIPNQIILTGLQLYLDAGNTSSYPGTGTTWYDLSGNANDVTMQNSSSISWTDWGIGYFTTGSDGWFSKASGVNIPTGNSNYTLSAWIQLGTSWGSQGIVSVGPFGSSNQANALRTSGTNGFQHYWWASDLNVSSTLTPTSTWFNVVARYNGTTRSVWVNGVSVGSDTPSGHNVTTSAIQVAKTYASEYLNGNIAQALIYNVSLSDSDILANYNATKSRFTLTIETNEGGGLVGWNSTAFAIAPNPAVGTTYPIGSQITFQNGEVRTMIGIDDYSPLYMDIFYDSPISTSILFPITIG